VTRTEMANQNATNQQSLRISAQMPLATWQPEKKYFLCIHKNVFHQLCFCASDINYFLSKNVNDLHALISSFTNAWLAKPRLFRTYDYSSEFCVEISMILCACVDAHATCSCFKCDFGTLLSPSSAFCFLTSQIKSTMEIKYLKFNHGCNQLLRIPLSQYLIFPSLRWAKTFA
jgi:hypothetical protein